MDNKIYEAIEMSIEELGRVFLQYPFIFLNEEDVRCYLYSMMLNKKVLNTPFKDTSGKHDTIRLHTQLAYEGTAKRDIPDILVLNDKSILIEPNKPIVFRDPKSWRRLEDDTPIEIKFAINPNSEWDNDSIKKDLNKLNEFDNKSYMVMVVICGNLNEVDVNSIPCNKSTLYYINANYRKDKPLFLKKKGNQSAIKI